MHWYTFCVYILLVDIVFYFTRRYLRYDCMTDMYVVKLLLCLTSLGPWLILLEVLQLFPSIPGLMSYTERNWRQGACNFSEYTTVLDVLLDTYRRDVAIWRAKGLDTRPRRWLSPLITLENSIYQLFTGRKVYGPIGLVGYIQTRWIMLTEDTLELILWLYTFGDMEPVPFYSDNIPLSSCIPFYTTTKCTSLYREGTAYLIRSTKDIEVLFSNGNISNTPSKQRLQMLGRLFPHLSLLMKGHESWVHRRQRLDRYLSGRLLQEWENGMDNIAKSTLNCWSPNSRFDIYKELYKYSVNCSLRTWLGIQDVPEYLYDLAYRYSMSRHTGGMCSWRAYFTGIWSSIHSGNRVYSSTQSNTHSGSQSSTETEELLSFFNKHLDRLYLQNTMGGSIVRAHIKRGHIPAADVYKYLLNNYSGNISIPSIDGQDVFIDALTIRKHVASQCTKITITPDDDIEADIAKILCQSYPSRQERPEAQDIQERSGEHQVLKKHLDSQERSEAYQVLDRTLDLQERSEACAELLSRFFGSTDQVAEVLRAVITMSGPREQDRLYEAVSQGDKVYIMNYIKEIIRLHPPSYVNDRQAIDNAEINGVQVKAETELWFSPYAIQRDYSIWGLDAHDIIPSRTYPEHAYVPFSEGPRRCPGRAFAYHEVYTFLCEIVKRFKWEKYNDIQGFSAGLTLMYDSMLVNLLSR